MELLVLVPESESEPEPGADMVGDVGCGNTRRDGGVEVGWSGG